MGAAPFTKNSNGFEVQSVPVKPDSEIGRGSGRNDFSPAFQGREKRSAISARHGSDA